MRRLDTETAYSKRAYFFGVIAFICYLIKSGINGVESLTGTPTPSSLVTVITSLLFIVISLCFYSAIKSIKEPATFKKVIGIILALGGVSYSLLQLYTYLIFT